MLSIHPIISYYYIIYILHEKYNTKKVYKQSNFNNYKNSLKQEIKFNTQRGNRIDDLMFENQNLLKVKIEYY